MTTGKSRDYSNGVFNNIYNFKHIEGSADIVKDLFNIDMETFITTFNILKTKRVEYAHPQISDTPSYLSKQVKTILETYNDTKYNDITA